MKLFAKTLSLGLLALCLAGCSSPTPDAVSDADQSAIDEYLATEAAEQSALAGEMKNADKATK